MFGFGKKSTEADAASDGAGLLNMKTISCNVGGKEIVFETGRFARLASGAVTARMGDTLVLATAVMSKNARENIDYFPLLVDYEERLYAAGKIKGSRWVKREGRASDEAILKGRVVDRTLRPLFPDGMRNDVQVVCTILSIDGENEPDMLAVNAASMALMISETPFDGPVAAVRVGKVDGQFVINPSPAQQEASTMDLIVSGNGKHIIMVEAGLKFVPEEEIVEGVKFAQQFLGILSDTQVKWQKEIGKPKAQGKYFTCDSRIMDEVKAMLTPEKIDSHMYVATKAERDANEAKLYEEITPAVTEKLKELEAEGIKLTAQTEYAIDYILKKYQQKQILEHEKRVDGRSLTETRKIICQVGVLPRTHGSALFTRGDTQALTTVTLGTKGDEQLLDGVEDPEEGRSKRYMHHYNFPGYSVGEVQPLRGAGRREIGHGALAERAVEVSLPGADKFPYTLRLVSEIMSSNGSTSMASTCGSTLALMDAGVPISNIVGGCAMGLVMDESNTDKFKVLTDILGIEDFNGHMDFKVTGTDTGVTALQLDIKVKGLTPEILETALMQAKPARIHIIDKMKEAISAPRAELSPFAPRIVTFEIKPDKIREVIGAGGKIINEIIRVTGVKIDIEDSGQVFVAGTDMKKVEEAVNWIKNIVREVEVGEIFDGKVMRLMDFGAFVEILPGKEGMVHVSELENYRVGKPEDVCKIGDTMKVQVMEIDDQGRINLTHKPFAAKPSEEQMAAARNSAGRGFPPRGPRPPHRSGPPHRGPRPSR